MLSSAPTAGQGVVADSTAASVRQAVAAFESGDTTVAESLLRSVLRDDPAAFVPELGSAAYWLGILLWEDGHRGEAIRVWHRGWRSLGRAGFVDLPLGDRFLWAVFGEADEAQFDAASAVYLSLLESIEAASGSQIQVVAARILVPLQMILPDSLRRVTGLAHDSLALAGRLLPGSGRILSQWWRAMDALPATERNERLVEHLRRVVTARDRYTSASPRGFDDRGSVYIRFGEPSRTVETRLNPFDLGQSFTNTTRGIRTTLSTMVPSFPRNEFWVYPAVAREAQFLFIRGRRGEYRLGTAYELVPTYLRTPRYARLRLKILEAILRDLALYHPLTYSAWYEEVAGYIMDLELGEISAQLDRLAGSPGLRVPLRFAPRSISEYYMGHHVMDERQTIRERDERIPVAFFDDFRDVAEVRVALRTARFLNDDGSTRVEMYWTAPTSEFIEARRRLNGGDRNATYDFVVETSLTEYDAASTRLGQWLVRKRIQDARLDDGGIVYPQVIVHDSLVDAHRLALQWDVLATPMAGEDLRREKVGTAVARLDSLVSLVDDRRVLEMSDLKPMLADASSGLDGPVYPGGVLTPDLRLGLEFEIYHLTFGADDRTHYTISYEMEREEDVGFRTRARQTPESHSITASSRYEGRTTSEREVIVLDLTEWDSSGRLRILVRVRDDTSGQEVERALDFDLEVGG